MYYRLGRYRYLGAIHIHSLFSDGIGNINTIVKAAKKAGLDWIIITDHNNFDIEEGIIDGVTVIKGEEISPKQENHYLALGINKCIAMSDDIKESINNVHINGGFGFAAHADESLNRKNHYKPIRWIDKNIVPDGVEIWNWFSMWADNFNDSNIFTMAYTFLFKNKQVKKPYRETLNWWDGINEKTDKIIPAIAGVDAHALKVRKYLIPITVFPYKFMFETLLNEIIIDKPLDNDFLNRKNQILNAIKEGKNIIINRQTIKTTPEFYIKNEEKIALVGESIALDNNTYLYFNCSRFSEIKVLKNSVEIVCTKSKNIKMKIMESGKYRIEVEIDGYGGVYSNMIMVLPPPSIGKSFSRRAF